MHFTRRTALAGAAALGVASPLKALAQARIQVTDKALIAAVAGAPRTAENKARDGARHPAETLTFWGLKPGMTVLEFNPGGGGYWTEILAPYLKATGGRYVATGAKPARFADEAVFGKTEWVTGAPAMQALAGQADMVIIARNIHNFMWTAGALDAQLKNFHNTLKPGGILAVEEHRADPRAQIKDARDGYVETKVLVGEVEKNGFKLQASSDVNANPKDTKDHPFGVWTLPPTRRSANPPAPADPAFNHAKYDAIGESDRMTLRFGKA